MPTYNRADLLPKTLGSILSQDFGDFEFLIVDDGSTDNTASLIEEIRAQDSRIRYLPLSENRGVGFAREVGVERASGKYVALADSDDPWLPGKLKEQVEVLQKYPDIDILFGDFWNIDYVRGTEARGFSECQAGMEHLETRALGNNLWFVEGGVEKGILKSNFIHPPTMLLKASVFEKVGGFATTQVTGADHEFCWRAAVLGAQFAYIDRPLIERHRYSSSVTARVDDAMMQLLDSMELCRQTCMSAQRPDLLADIREAEQRIYRILIEEYSDEGNRTGIWWAFRKSLKKGFSLRTLAFFVMGMAGSRVMSFSFKWRARLLRLSSKVLEANG